MPLFGKKSGDEKGSPSKGYPTQQPAYPTQQPAYPTHQPAYAPGLPVYPGQQATQPQAFGGELPPPYSPYPQSGPVPAGAAGPYPQQPMGAYPQQPMGAYPQPPMGAYPQQPMGAYPQQPMGPYPPQPVGAYPQPQFGAYAAPQAGVAVAGGSFDAGARFGAGATPNIPPPPPGSMPNMAQVASGQGQTVVVNQEKSSWLTGGSGGGMTFW